MRAEERIRNVLAKLGDTTASVYIVPDFFVFELLHARWTNVNGLPAVSVFENPLYGVDGLAKRTADLVFGSLLLAAAAVPMLRHRGGDQAHVARPGVLPPAAVRPGRPRDSGLEIPHDDLLRRRRRRAAGHARRRPHHARSAALLRRTSLDELPQLFNVVEGSMSLVGPRPHANAHNEQYRSLIDGYMLRHKVKPGITGLAQVSGYRGETETLEKMERRVACDHQYIREWSLWMDAQNPVQDAASRDGTDERVLGKVEEQKAGVPDFSPDFN